MKSSNGSLKARSSLVRWMVSSSTWYFSRSWLRTSLVVVSAREWVSVLYAWFVVVRVMLSPECCWVSCVGSGGVGSDCVRVDWRVASRVLRCGADGGAVSARDDWLVGVVGLDGELHGTLSALEVSVGVGGSER